MASTLSPWPESFSLKLIPWWKTQTNSHTHFPPSELLFHPTDTDYFPTLPRQQHTHTHTAYFPTFLMFLLHSFFLWLTSSTNTHTCKCTCAHTLWPTEVGVLSHLATISGHALPQQSLSLRVAGALDLSSNLGHGVQHGQLGPRRCQIGRTHTNTLQYWYISDNYHWRVVLHLHLSLTSFSYCGSEKCPSLWGNLVSNKAKNRNIHTHSWKTYTPIAENDFWYPSIVYYTDTYNGTTILYNYPHRELLLVSN